MITREMLMDAVGRLVADMADGAWEPNSLLGSMHPAIVNLFDHLPAAPEPGATRPLKVLLDASALGPEHVGYLLGAGLSDGSWPTIASVERRGYDPDARQGNGANVTRVTLVEYPGYHLDLTGGVLLRAAVEPLKSTEPDSDAHPDLIDRENDTWHWYEGYSLNGAGLYSRTEVGKQWGPVRDA